MSNFALLILKGIQDTIFTDFFNNNNNERPIRLTWTLTSIRYFLL